MRPTTLCFPVRSDGKLLLGRKKRGFGVSKWNGFGGKIEAGEDFLQCAVRELQEETGLIAREEDLELVGFLDFHFSASPELNHIGFVYFLRTWQGNIQETEEMEPKWFDPAALPYDEMWKGDRTWIPMLLKKEKVKGIIPLLKTTIRFSIWNCTAWIHEKNENRPKMTGGHHVILGLFMA